MTRWNDHYTKNYRSEMARLKALVDVVTGTHRRAIERHGSFFQRRRGRARMNHRLLARMGIRRFVSRYRID